MLQTVEVKERLLETLREFVADWGLDVPITSETKLVEDLEFDSIDVIQFVVAIESTFNSRTFGFQALLMRDGRYVDDLEVGEIQAFIEQRLAGL